MVIFDLLLGEYECSTGTLQDELSIFGVQINNDKCSNIYLLSIILRKAVQQGSDQFL